jgi:glycerophosphoryl diester phosphodiesterase
VHELRPAVTTALLGSPTPAQLRKDAPFTDLVNPSYGSLTKEYVAAAHALRGAHGRPLRVCAWTVNDAVTARKVAGYGVYGIITNKPDVVRAALGSY